MSKVKMMGASPLTGIIYYGTLDTEKSMWVGKKLTLLKWRARQWLNT